MLYRILADLVVVIHFAFIVFVVIGGFIAARWPVVAFAHLPTAVWGAWIELSGGICPLTPLENRFRQLGGRAGYDGGFIEHYLLALIYPDGLTRSVQLTLGVGVIVINVVAYALVVLRITGESPGAAS